MNRNVAAGAYYALTVLTPVLPGRCPALRAHLEALPPAAGSPLAAVPGTHLARWVVIEQLVYQGPPQRRDELGSPHLLFTSNFDGDRDRYLEGMRVHMGAQADAVWGHCAGYPGSGDPAAFAAYFRRNQLPTSLFVAGYPGATLERVRRALDLRDRLIAFALRAQDLDAEGLHAAFLERFSGEPG